MHRNGRKGKGAGVAVMEAVNEVDRIRAELKIRDRQRAMVV
jgi:hypothetical protein